MLYQRSTMFQRFWIELIDAMPKEHRDFLHMALNLGLLPVLARCEDPQFFRVSVSCSRRDFADVLKSRLSSSSDIVCCEFVSENGFIPFWYEFSTSQPLSIKDHVMVGDASISSLMRAASLGWDEIFVLSSFNKSLSSPAQLVFRGFTVDRAVNVQTVTGKCYTVQPGAMVAFRLQYSHTEQAQCMVNRETVMLDSYRVVVFVKDESTMLDISFPLSQAHDILACLEAAPEHTLFSAKVNGISPEQLLTSLLEHHPVDLAECLISSGFNVGFLAPPAKRF